MWVTALDLVARCLRDRRHRNKSGVPQSVTFPGQFGSKDAGQSMAAVHHEEPNCFEASAVMVADMHHRFIVLGRDAP